MGAETSAETSATGSYEFGTGRREAGGYGYQNGIGSAPAGYASLYG